MPSPAPGGRHIGPNGQSITDFCWYHGRVERSRTESMLAKRPVGSFLVRDSSSIPGDFVISVSDNTVASGCTHYIVNFVSGRYFAGDVYFNSLPAVIEHYEMHKLGPTVLGAYVASGRPVPRKPKDPDTPPPIGERKKPEKPGPLEKLSYSDRHPVAQERTTSPVQSSPPPLPKLSMKKKSSPRQWPPPMATKHGNSRFLQKLPACAMSTSPVDRNNPVELPAIAVEKTSGLKLQTDNRFSKNIPYEEVRPLADEAPVNRSQSRPIPHPKTETVSDGDYCEPPCKPARRKSAAQRSAESTSPPSSYGSFISGNSFSSMGSGDRAWSMGQTDESAVRSTEFAGMSIQEESEISMAIAIYARTANAYDPTSLVFEAGDEVVVLEQKPSGTWYGECKGRTGYFPFTAVQLYA